MATLVVESVPPDTEVLLDGTSLGTVSSGNVKKNHPCKSPYNHAQKTELCGLRRHPRADNRWSDGHGYRRQNAGMIAKVTPANATIIYKRNGAQQANELQNDQELSLPP